MSALEQLQEKHGLAMRPAEVARVLHCSPDHIRKMCQRGEIKASHMGARWIIPTIEVAAIIDGVTA